MNRFLPKQSVSSFFSLRLEEEDDLRFFFLFLFLFFVFSFSLMTSHSCRRSRSASARHLATVSALNYKEKLCRVPNSGSVEEENYTQKLFFHSFPITLPSPRTLALPGHSFPLVHWLQNFSGARTTRSTKYWFVKGFADHFSKSHRPPVIRGADFGNHCSNVS